MASSAARGPGSASSATSPAAAGRATRSTSGTTTGARPRIRRSCRSSRSSTTWARPSIASAPSVVVVGHGMGGLLALKAAERHPVSGLILVAPELPADVRTATAPHQIREIPELFGPSLLGWATLPEKLQRDHRDLSLADVLRVQHLMGQKPHESGRARRTMLRGVKVDPDRLADVPKLVIGGGLDQVVPVDAARAARDVARRRVRAVRRALALRPDPRRGELHAGRRRDPGVPGGSPPLGLLECRLPATSRRPVPHSSRGPGHRPLKAEIIGSNPICGTTPPADPTPLRRWRVRSAARGGTDPDF